MAPIFADLSDNEKAAPENRRRPKKKNGAGRPAPFPCQV